MKKTAITLATLACVASTLTAPEVLAQGSYPRSSAERNNTGAVVAGIAAIGLGIALATSKHGDRHRHDTQWDGNLYGDPFSPANNVICMPQQRKCYYNGYVSYPWTSQIFGSYGGFGGSGGSWGSDFGGSGGSWSGGGQNLDLARQICVERAEQRGLRNIRVDAVRPEGSKRALVWMESRRSPMTMSTERWRCEYRFKSGRTDFRRV